MYSDYFLGRFENITAKSLSNNQYYIHTRWYSGKYKVWEVYRCKGNLFPISWQLGLLTSYFLFLFTANGYFGLDWIEACFCCSPDIQSVVHYLSCANIICCDLLKQISARNISIEFEKILLFRLIFILLIWFICK